VDQQRNLFISLATAIVGFGIVMVYSASITSWPTEFERIYVSRQLAALGVGVIIASVCTLLPPDFWRRFAPLLLAATIVLLVAVLIPGVGTRVNGARRWLRFGGFQFQPSELAKISLTLYLCRQALNSPHDLRSRRQALKAIVGPILITAGLVMAEPDLGTAVFLMLFSCIALFASGWPLRNFLVAGLCGLPALGLVFVLRPYQLRRLTGFWATWSDWSQVPYQLDQSLVSLGAGGLFRVGLGKGWQKLSFLPEANTDFVFAVVGEELGLLGTLGLLALWGAFYWAGLRIVREMRDDRFAATAAFALLTQTVVQALANMAVVTALVPPKGIPLPLVSYGGSALVMGLASLGIVLSLSRGTRPLLATQLRRLESS